MYREHTVFGCKLCACSVLACMQRCFQYCDAMPDATKPLGRLKWDYLHMPACILSEKLMSCILFCSWKYTKESLVVAMRKGAVSSWKPSQNTYFAPLKAVFTSSIILIWCRLSLVWRVIPFNIAAISISLSRDDTALSQEAVHKLNNASTKWTGVGVANGGEERRWLG